MNKNMILSSWPEASIKFPRRRTLTSRILAVSSLKGNKDMNSPLKTLKLILFCALVMANQGI